MQLYVVDTSLDGKIRVFGAGGIPLEFRELIGNGYFESSEAVECDQCVALLNHCSQAFHVFAGGVWRFVK